VRLKTFPPGFQIRPTLDILFRMTALLRHWKSLNDLPGSSNALMVRTDFEHEAEWQAFLESIENPGPEEDTDYRAALEVVQDPKLDKLESGPLMGALPAQYQHSFLFVVDRRTLEDVEHPVLIIDLINDKGRTFRLVPAQIHSIEANLSLSNMDFFEFADNADADGVFRGFPES